jgi:hypothetical protein
MINGQIRDGHPFAVVSAQAVTQRNSFHGDTAIKLQIVAPPFSPELRVTLCS